MKNFIFNICKKNVFLRRILREIKYLLEKIKYKKYKWFNKVDDKMVIFESFDGRNYSDSPKAIYLEMLKDVKFSGYKFVWAFVDDTIDSHQAVLKNKNTSIVKSGSKEYFKCYAKAKYWIVNAKVNDGIIPKKNQVFVETWHGTPLKKLRCDITCNSLLNTTAEQNRRNEIDTKRFTYFISPSRFATEKFNSSFRLKEIHKKDIIIEKGYPRNDFLFTYNDDDIKRIKKNLGIKSNKKIILYAPTFRDNQHENYKGYTYNLGLDIDYLKNNLEDEYIILFRTHYFVSNSIDFSKYKGFICDVSKYDDVNDLYIISDALITDYSSVFFDFANLKRPMFFYMYDKEEYKNNLRDFYIDLDELPGPISEKQKDLIKDIKKINEYWDNYEKKYIAFQKKYNYLDGPNCSKKVIEEVFNETKN